MSYRLVMTPRLLLSLLCLGVLALSMPALAGKAKPYKEIDAKELMAMQASQHNLVVIDSRGDKHFDGQLIEGAVHLPVSEMEASDLAKLAQEKESPLVFYCSCPKCKASAFAAHKAADTGYVNLYKYTAGIEDWQEKGLPTSKL